MTVISPLLFGFSLLLSLWVILPGFGIAINHLSKPRGIRSFNGGRNGD